MKLKRFWPILKGTFSEFNEDKVLRLSAALAYYAIFSIGPLLVIALGLAGLAFGHETVRHEIQQQLRSIVGEKSAAVVESMMSAPKRGTSLITAIVGLVALFFGAAGVFGQLQDSLNTIWEVKPKPGAGVWGFVRQRFISLSMVLGTGFLLLVSLALSTFLSAITGSIGGGLPLSEFLAHALDFIVSFGVISLLFAMIFKYLPDVKVSLRKVWVGAIGTAALFTIGKYLLALYLGRAGTSSSYGAAGSVLVILMWIYYASVILLFGAEFTQVYATQTGWKPAPTKYAVPVTHEERAEQGIPKRAPSRQPSKTEGQEGRVPTGRSPSRYSPSADFLVPMLAIGLAGSFLMTKKPFHIALRVLRNGLLLYRTFQHR